MFLPCPKGLWSAQTKSEWEREYIAQSNLESQNNNHRLTFGNLLQQDAEVGPFSRLLDLWLAQVDDFGTLVMAFASLSEGGEYITP
jgi:hypothetical protein